LSGFVGITGTPGTGKKTLAPMIASMMGLPCISLYEDAVASGLIRSNETDAKVDTAALGRYVAKHATKPALVYGHLLPYVLEDELIARVIVLRCEPKTLKTRLNIRGYSRKKIRENLEAELIGVLSSESVRKYGRSKAVELDTTKAAVAGAALGAFEYLKRGTRPGPRIDWMPRYSSASRLRDLLS